MHINIGSIVKIRNICFKDGIVDHSYKVGRPCVFIGEVDEKMYFIPLSHMEKSKNYESIMPNDFNNLRKPSQINVRNVIEKDLFYPEITGELFDEELEKIFNSIKKYYKTVRNDIGRNVVFLADNYFKGKYVDDDSNSLKKDDENIK